MPLPVRWRYKLDRWHSQVADLFHSETQSFTPTPLHRLRDAGRLNSRQVPSVRREYDVFLRRDRPVSLGRWMPSDFTGNVRNAGHLLRDVRAVVCDHNEIFGRRKRRRRFRWTSRDRLPGRPIVWAHRFHWSMSIQPALATSFTAIFLHGGLMHIGCQHVGFDGYRTDG